MHRALRTALLQPAAHFVLAVAAAHSHGVLSSRAVDDAYREAKALPHDVFEMPIVGGHSGVLTSAAQPLVFKPLQSGKRGEAELAFYELIAQRSPQDPASFLPRYHGLAVQGSPAPCYFLVLEDLARPFHRPSILDVKVGVQTWGEDAPPAKAAAERAKFPLQQRVGFRVTGMRVWQPVAGAYKEHGRAFGYALTEETLHAAFREFLHDGARVRSEAVPPLLSRLRALEAWFAVQADFRFYGSSLLFLYEGEEGEAGPTRPAVAVDVRLIDFAHATPIQKGGPEPGPRGARDEGFLLGLRSVMRCLERVAAEAEAEAAGGARGAAVSTATA
jgi:hypothetical protein